MRESVPQTANSLPAEIVVEPLLPVGTRYILPPHGFRKTGLAMIVFSLAALAFLVFWTNGWLAGFQAGFGDWGLAAAIFIAPFFIGDFALLGIGLTFAFGHSEIEVDDERMRWIERVGSFRWRSSRPLVRIRRLSVESVDSHESYSSSALQTGAFTAIKVETTGKPWWIAMANDRGLLAPLAKCLAIECNAAAAETGNDAIVAFVETVAGPPRRTERPAGTPVVCERFADGVTFEVPPAGIRGSAGLFVFALFWCGFITVFSTMFLRADKGADGNMWIFGGVVLLFWCIGIGMLLAAIDMGRRRAAVAVVGESVMAMQTGLLRSRSGDWQRAEIKEIRVGPSRFEVNERPVLQLQIVPVTGKTFGLLTGRDTAELEWMATLLSDALHERTGGDAQS